MENYLNSNNTTTKPLNQNKMKKLLHFFGLETREEIMEFKQRREQKPFLMLIRRINELEDRIKELEKQTFKST